MLTQEEIEQRKQNLTEEQLNICFRGGTEAPFSGDLLGNKKTGTYSCIVCDNPLYSSEAKFESGSGWPSFFQPVSDDAIKEKEDTSHGMVRTEIQCANCGAHLGHVFSDGPKDKGGKRFCINSIALKFVAKDNAK